MLDAFEAGTLHERAIIALAATMGLRRTEIATLHPMDRTENTLRVLGKNRAVRYLQLDENTLACLLSLEEEQGRESYYFPGRFGGHVHPATVYKWAKALIGHDWTLHACRRRAATEGYRATHNVYAVQQFLGHSSIATTQIYVNVNAEDVAAVANTATLSRSPTSRHIAGLPHALRTDIDEKERFLHELAHLTRVAREHGMEVLIR
ncbi:tyrosine-type recombinase/integrase [Agromyces bauzanensis]